MPIFTDRTLQTSKMPSVKEKRVFLTLWYPNSQISNYKNVLKYIFQVTIGRKYFLKFLLE